MKSKIIAILLITVTLFSCKKEEKKTDEAKPAVENKNIFKVSFDLVVLKDDNFHLYYTEDGTINFNEKQSIWVPVKGNTNPQEIVFNLPEDVIPTHLRADFGLGKNETQSDVVLKDFKMSYFDKNFEANGAQIFNYFYPNELCTVVDKPTATLKRVKKDQNTGPSLYPQIGLTEEISKLVK